jgi:hypothetical protein
MNLHINFSLNSYRNQNIYKCGPSKIIHITTFLPFWVQTWQHVLICHDYSQNTCKYCVIYYQVFWQCHNNWDTSTIFDKPYMPKVFYYYHFFLLQVYYSLLNIVHFSKSNNSNDVLIMFEHLCILVNILWILKIVGLWQFEAFQKYVFNTFKIKHLGECIIGWYKKEHHTFIVLYSSNFKKI